jgi:hypothetical protein
MRQTIRRATAAGLGRRRSLRQDSPGRRSSDKAPSLRQMERMSALEFALAMDRIGCVDVPLAVMTEWTRGDREAA